MLLYYTGVPRLTLWSRSKKIPRYANRVIVEYKEYYKMMYSKTLICFTLLNFSLEYYSSNCLWSIFCIVYCYSNKPIENLENPYNSNRNRLKSLQEILFLQIFLKNYGS